MYIYCWLIEKAPESQHYGEAKGNCDGLRGHARYLLQHISEYSYYFEDRKYKKLRDQWISKASEFMENLLNGPNQAEAAMLPQIQTPLFV